MDKKDFADLLSNNQLLKAVSYQELEALLLKYPYCSNLRFLLVKKFSFDEHHTFNNQLNLAATYARDRKFLYNYLRSEQTVDMPQKEETTDSGEEEGSSEILFDLSSIDMNSSLKTDEANITEEQDTSIEEILAEIAAAVTVSTPTEAVISNENTIETITEPTQEIVEETVIEDNITASKEEDSEEPIAELAEQSLLSSDDIISELLAEILALQGKTSAAIRMYQQLSLKFPEKSSFFAERIENLKNRL